MAGKISTATAAQDTGVLDAYDAIVASPRGTYANSHGALAGIRYAREFAISDGIRGLRRIGLAWSEGRVVPTEEPTATIRTRPHKHSVSAELNPVRNAHYQSVDSRMQAMRVSPQEGIRGDSLKAVVHRTMVLE